MSEMSRVHMFPVAGRHYISIFTSKECGVYSKISVVFRMLLKVTIAGPSSNSSTGMENNNENCMDFLL